MSRYSENIIIGAGAAGLFCAAQLGKLGKQATIFDNGKKIGRKILMSGGGFCNFTNMEITSGRYISQNNSKVNLILPLKKKKVRSNLKPNPRFGSLQSY